MDRKTTQMIKGTAILMMVLHHFCATTLFPELELFWIQFGATFKICVAIYAVLSGYGYFFAKNKTVKYGLKKIGGLLEIYWISLVTLFIPVAAYAGGGVKITPKLLFINLFGLLPNINWFAWYVFFYIFCMLVMPFVYKGFKFKPTVNFGIAIIVPYLIEVVLHSVPNYESITVVHDLFSCFLYFPCFLVGYLMTQHKIIETLNKKVPCNIIMSFTGIIIVFIARYFVASVAGLLLDVIYAPLIIYFTSNIFGTVVKRDYKIVKTVFSVLGTYSTGMWFFHAVFFSTYLCDIFRPILTLVKNPVIMYIWCVVLSLLGAFAYQKLLEGLHYIPELVKRRVSWFQ